MYIIKGYSVKEIGGTTCSSSVFSHRFFQVQLVKLATYCLKLRVNESLIMDLLLKV